MNTKKCKKCGHTKERSKFSKSGNASKDTIKNSCKACDKLQTAAYQIKNKDKIALRKKGRAKESREWHLRTTYGLSIESYDAMHKSQNGCCKICSIVEKHAPRQILYVDHDHDTGAVRGLLCGKCNTAIGLLQDSSEFTIKATTYLQENGK